MKLILIRHAKAEERDPVLYRNDDLRPLSAKGVKEHEWVSRALARMDLGIEQIWSSPWLRAVQTAEITARELDLKTPIVQIPELGPTYSVEGLCRAFRRPRPRSIVAAVGHQPFMSHFAAAMLEPQGSAGIDFKKSGIMGLEFEDLPAPGEAVLLFFFPPKLLARVG